MQQYDWLMIIDDYPMKISGVYQKVPLTKENIWLDRVPEID